MNWSVIGKISVIILGGGGFGFSSWLLWPQSETKTNTKYWYVYTTSETVSDSDLASELFNTSGFHKNFECKISSASFSCEILQPKIGVSATSTLRDKYKTNPDKVNKQDLKSENNVYVVKMDEQYKNEIISSTAKKIEVVSKKDKTKKYASLKINVTFDSDHSLVMPSTAVEESASSDNNDIMSIITTGINTGDSGAKKKKQEQLIQVVGDADKMDVAKKVFKGCGVTSTPKRASCVNVENSLNLLVGNFGSQFTDKEEGYAIEVLAKANEKKVIKLFDNLNTIEKIKSNSDLSTYTLGLSKPVLGWISNWYTKTAITKMENAKKTS